jgi:cbb3-type cytochrome oxidase subunit 1
VPTLTRWFIKAALVYLVVALLVGIVVAMQAVVDAGPLIGALTPVYFHLFMVGFVAQVIFGVAYWMFPRHSKERPRGSEALALVTYLALNAGLISRAIAEPMVAVEPVTAWRGLLAVAAVLQWLAGVTFAANTWSRVKER